MGALDWELEREGALHSWPHPSGMEPVLLSWWTEMWTRAGHESGATDALFLPKVSKLSCINISSFASCA